MLTDKSKNIITFFSWLAIFTVILATTPIFLYLKVLPWVVSNSKALAYVEGVIEKAYNIDVDIKQPYLKTEFSPKVSLGLSEFSIISKEKEIIRIKDIDTVLSLEELFSKKKIIINKISLDKLYADVNGVLDLPFLKQEEKSEESLYSIDIFKSTMEVGNIDLDYLIDPKTKAKLNVQDIKIGNNTGIKQVSYKIIANVIKNNNQISVKTSDNGNVFIENFEKLLIKDSKIEVSQLKNGRKQYANIVNFKGNVDNKSNYDVTLCSKNFRIPAIIALLDSQLVENNLSEQLVFFKDIDGFIDFNVRATNKSMKGDVSLSKLSLKFIPLYDLPVLLNNGKIKFDDNKIILSDFKGYYNNRSSNKLDFKATVDDYMKTVDLDLVGNAVVNNDFSQNYFSKLVGYPVKMKGSADTRVMVKSKNNKFDIVWLYRFKKGNGFIFDGEESFMNDAANRVLAAKMHFENMMLNLKSVDYYAGNPEDDMKDKRIPIVSFNSNIDFSKPEPIVKDFGLSLPKPMPSGFINMLIKQKLFRNGNFTGNIKVLNLDKSPILLGSMKAEKVGIPSQRLFIKEGEFYIEDGLMKIKSEGKYRRSKYDLKGSIVNQLKFPIIVKNIELDLDSIDVEKYLQIFNAQQPTDVNTDLGTAISQAVENSDNVDEDDTTQTFDLANLIVEECVLKVQKGFYKGINFSDVVATLTLDKNSFLKIVSNRFNIAEGISSAKVECDLKEHKYNVRLGVKDVNADVIATSLLNLPKEIVGKATGLIELNTDESLKLNGRIQFRVDEGVIAKVGLIEYVMKVASIFRNPITMVSPTIITDLVSIPEGKFDVIKGDLKLKDNVIIPMHIRSSSPQLSSFIVGTYNLETSDAALRVYTKFSNSKKGVMGLLRNISLNSIANRIPLSSRNDGNYYESEISQIPEIEADEKDCQIFLTKIDGDIEHNNYISSLKKIK